MPTIGGIDITFYEQYTKQPNSTQRPTEVTPTPYSTTFHNCIMWDGVSIMAPTVIVTMLSGTDHFDNPAALGMTYCYIPQFGRFYWVLDWQLIESQWVATLQVDVLASFKDEIANATIFADRLGDRKGPGYPNTSVLTPVDTGLPDNMIPTLSRPYMCHDLLSLSWLRPGLPSGCYVLGIINADAGAVGAVSYYAMSGSQFRVFMSALLSGTYLGANLDVSQETAKAILNPFQYVATCSWFPLTLSDVADGNPERTGLALGWWNLGSVKYYNISDSGVVRKAFTYRLREHPYAPANKLNMSMLNYPPYTEYWLTLPYFGSCVLTRSDFQSGELTGLVTFDLISGLAQCRLYDKFPYGYDYNEGRFPSTSDLTNIIGYCNLVRTLSAQASTPIQVAQTTSDYGAAKVTQIVASATATSNSAMLARSYASSMSSAILGTVGAGVSLLGGSLTGAASGLLGAAAQYNEAQLTRKYNGAAVAAQNQAARASGAYTSAVQKAPKVETSGNNGSVMESLFPAELVSEYLIPSTITNHIFERNYQASGDVSYTQGLLEWVGYAHGQVIQIREHTGYIQGHDPQFYSYRALAPEVDQIKQYMADGFFYQ